MSRYFHAVTKQAHENETNLIVICTKMLIRLNHSLTGGPGMMFQIIPAHFFNPPIMKLPVTNIGPLTPQLKALAQYMVCS